MTAGDQVTPDVAFLSDGRAVIVWHDTGTGNIKGQTVSFTPALQ